MIFYFSGTGNTKWAAKDLAASTDDKLINMADAIPGDCSYNLTDDERLGFAFPIHGWRVPIIVIRFIEKLKLNYTGQYCYAVVTAGDSIGLADERLDKLLASKGIRLDACFSLIMPESYVGLPFMDVDTLKKENEKKQKAASDLDTYIKCIVKREKGVSMVTHGPLPGFFSGPVGAFFLKHLITDKPFHVDKDRCTGCGTCEKLCPVNDIDIADDGEKATPQWKHNGKCLTCFSCYHHCPVKAISYGHRTKGKGQYFYNRNHIK